MVQKMLQKLESAEAGVRADTYIESGSAKICQGLPKIDRKRNAKIETQNIEAARNC